MAPDDDDSEDLYDDEFDFVDDDDDDDDDASDLDDDDDDSELDSGSGAAADSALEAEIATPADSELDDEPTPRAPAPKRPARASRDEDSDRGPEAGPDDVERDGERFDDLTDDEDAVDEFAPPAPAANFRVHIYEYRQFKRTIDRPFTAEDAEAFASEFNRTSKSYGRFALAGKEDAKPRKLLDD